MNKELNQEALREIRAIETITFHGHENILGLHRNTIELTMDKEISKRADCIIGVGSDKACAQLNRLIKDHIKEGGGLEFDLEVGGEFFKFFGRGSTGLTLEDPREIVLRKSYFESPRTASTRCTAAATDIPRHMIEMLKNRRQKGSLTVIPLELEPQDDFASLSMLP